MSGELFLSSSYLDALQASSCVSADNGWHSLPEAGPATYRKDHSWGEFVFDFEFANVYQQAGLDYYPKLLCAVPFTPVTGPRLQQRSAADLQQLMLDQQCSSAHVLFLPDAEAQVLAEAGWHRRQDIRFVWRNQNYADFEEFLAALSSKKRKNIRRERRKLDEQGLEASWLSSHEVAEQHWPWIYRLYADTYHRRGQEPYLNEACLRAWALGLPQQLLFCLALNENAQVAAMAMFFRDEHALYGRHWGAAVDADALHFELCYYQGIEYCLQHDLAYFDAGVQGGHRLLRGFVPELSHSAHHFAQPRFDQMIGQYLQRERAAVATQLEKMQQETAYRQA